MSKIDMNHSVASSKRRTSRRGAEGAQDIFDKLDAGDTVEKPVEDPADDVSETAAEMPQKIRSLRELLLFGNVTHTFQIDGFQFVMRSLSNKESREIAKRLFLMPDEDKLVESNIMHAAASIDLINGLKPAEAYEGLFGQPAGDKTSMDINIEILSHLNNFFVGKIIEEYFVVSKMSKDALTDEEATEDVKK